jgi:hypothetical protein
MRGMVGRWGRVRVRVVRIMRGMGWVVRIMRVRVRVRMIRFMMMTMFVMFVMLPVMSMLLALVFMVLILMMFQKPRRLPNSSQSIEIAGSGTIVQYIGQYRSRFLPPVLYSIDGTDCGPEGE